QVCFGAYLPLCSNPLGNTLVRQINDEDTDTQGFIARDDSMKEIVVAFRGSSSPVDFLTDFNSTLIHFDSPGVDTSLTNYVEAHRGFLEAYNSVAPIILSNIVAQLQEYPTYSLVLTGHSLGGALASLGGISLATNFPGKSVRVYTFGQPRTGNDKYAALAETLIGPDNIFRDLSSFPTMVPRYLGYQHHSTEYWFFQDPSNDAKNLKVCSGAEDPNCSDAIPSGGINLPHFTYCGNSKSVLEYFT
ncbi:alpha/beta-hydrolase, partial [Phellopilus nigrolimitatus]